MLNAIAIKQLTRNIPTQPKKRVEPINETKEYEHKGRRKPNECCTDNWDSLVIVLYCRKTVIKQCPVCLKCYEVKK